MTPREARAAGADLVVVGRPLRDAADPAAAARAIVARAARERRRAATGARARCAWARSGVARDLRRRAGARGRDAATRERPGDLGRSAARGPQRARSGGRRSSSRRAPRTSASRIAIARRSIARRARAPPPGRGRVARPVRLRRSRRRSIAGRRQPALVVALDGVEDPRNLGAILRSAYLLGARRRDHPRAPRGAGHARSSRRRRPARASSSRSRRSATSCARSTSCASAGCGASPSHASRRRAADRDDRRRRCRSASCSAPRAAACVRSSRRTATSTRSSRWRATRSARSTSRSPRRSRCTRSPASGRQRRVRCVECVNARERRRRRPADGQGAPAHPRRAREARQDAGGERSRAPGRGDPPAERDDPRTLHRRRRRSPAPSSSVVHVGGAPLASVRRVRPHSIRSSAVPSIPTPRMLVTAGPDQPVAEQARARPSASPRRGAARDDRARARDRR